MRKLLLLASCFLWLNTAHAQIRAYNYPESPKQQYSEEKFGETVNDPFHWLEDMQSDSTKKWVEKQNKFLDEYRRSVFAKYTTCERLLVYSVVNSWASDKIPYQKQKYYFSKGGNDPMVDNIYYRENRKDPAVLLCTGYPFQKNDKDKVTIRGIVPSLDYRYIAIIVSHNGSDWQEVYVYDMATKKLTAEKIEWVKFSDIVWNSKGFFYLKFNEVKDKLSDASNSCKLMFHPIGNKQTDDEEVLAYSGIQSESLRFQGIDSSKHLILYYTEEVKGKLISVVAELDPENYGAGVKPFIKAPYKTIRDFEVFGINDSLYFVNSTYKAPNGRVMVYRRNTLNSGRVLIEEFNQQLRFVNKLKNRVFCIYYDKGNFLPIVFDETGVLLKQIKIPAGYGVEGFEYTVNDSTTLYSLNSFHTMSKTVGYDFKNLQTIVYGAAVGEIFDKHYTAKIVNYPSKDSTLVPMYVVHLSNLKIDTSTPVLMYGYGGFGNPTDPFFNPGFSIFITQGGVLAVPLVRGGGEFGEDWHKAGSGLNKQNCVDDFIGAAEWLINNNYTSKGHIAIQGGSHGGFLVGAALVQRPDLYKVVVGNAGLYDLVNFPKFTTAASVGIKEFGNPEDSASFKYLLKMSPYHNVKRDVIYPATMLVTGDNDDRVVPLHSFKFLAGLQTNTKLKLFPYLLYLEDNAGHGSEGTWDDFQQMALVYTFIFQNLGININALNVGAKD